MCICCARKYSIYIHERALYGERRGDYRARARFYDADVLSCITSRNLPDSTTPPLQRYAARFFLVRKFLVFFLCTFGYTRRPINSPRSEIVRKRTLGAGPCVCRLYSILSSSAFLLSSFSATVRFAKQSPSNVVRTIHT